VLQWLRRQDPPGPWNAKFSSGIASDTADQLIAEYASRTDVERPGDTMATRGDLDDLAASLGYRPVGEVAVPSEYATEADLVGKCTCPTGPRLTGDLDEAVKAELASQGFVVEPLDVLHSGLAPTAMLDNLFPVGSFLGPDDVREALQLKTLKTSAPAMERFTPLTGTLGSDEVAARYPEVLCASFDLPNPVQLCSAAFNLDFRESPPGFMRKLHVFFVNGTPPNVADAALRSVTEGNPQLQRESQSGTFTDRHWTPAVQADIRAARERWVRADGVMCERRPPAARAPGA
jgi:hypothetical protein